MKHSIRCARVGLFTLSLVLAAPLALAQDDGGRAGREREALRRAQAALRQAQEQQSALAREKGEVSAQRDKLGEVAKRTETQLSASRSEAARAIAQVAALTTDLRSARDQAEAQRKEAEARITELSKQLSEANRLAEERARANGGLTALLEHATRSLTAAEKANREMHAFGLQMIERLRGRGAAEDLAQNDPVLGFGKIRLENEAEALRDRLDAARMTRSSQ
ncbi:MAG: hypothetical protein ABUL50_09210 [Rhizobacter sp.]